VVLQAGIIASGNFGFFNYLTMALCVVLLDDRDLPKMPEHGPGPGTARQRPEDRVYRPGMRLSYAEWAGVIGWKVAIPFVALVAMARAVQQTFVLTRRECDQPAGVLFWYGAKTLDPVTMYTCKRSIWICHERPVRFHGNRFQAPLWDYDLQMRLTSQQLSRLVDRLARAGLWMAVCLIGTSYAYQVQYRPPLVAMDMRYAAINLMQPPFHSPPGRNR
jgi:hypothetical protein